jgi:hypothetical protein
MVVPMQDFLFIVKKTIYPTITAQPNELNYTPKEENKTIRSFPIHNHNIRTG